MAVLTALFGKDERQEIYMYFESLNSFLPFCCGLERTVLAMISTMAL